jgi:hypothetical protein
MFGYRSQGKGGSGKNREVLLFNREIGSREPKNRSADVQGDYLFWQLEGGVDPQTWWQ